MKHVVLSREDAQQRYGEEFVAWIMRGKDSIALTPEKQVLIEKWKMMREQKLMPFAYEYIYLISNGRGDFKVGVTRSPKTRVSTLKTGTSDDLTLLGLFIVGGQAARNIERAIHTALKSEGAHVSGEWFRGDTPKRIAWIVDFAESRYGKHLVSLSEAYEGCEPIWRLYAAANWMTQEADMCEKARKDFLWVKSQAENGLTILS